MQIAERRWITDTMFRTTAFAEVSTTSLGPRGSAACQRRRPSFVCRWSSRRRLDRRPPTTAASFRPLRHHVCVLSRAPCRQRYITAFLRGPATTVQLPATCAQMNLTVARSLSLRFKRPFSRWTWVNRCLFKQRMMVVVVTTGLLEL